MKNLPIHEARVIGALACVIAAGLCLASCDNSDPTAPADSTISVSANPQTVVVPVGGSGTTDVTATLRSKNGTRLPDQEVTFSTTAGTLDPPAETPVLTNKDGQASSTLTTSTSATVTARSGGISGTTQIQTASCDLTPFTLNPDVAALSTCSDRVTFTALVQDTNGDPCVNITVIFEEDPGNKLRGTFSSGQVGSNAMGEAVVTWIPLTSQCESKCTDAGDTTGPGDCGILNFTATDVTGSFRSTPVQITDNIP